MKELKEKIEILSTLLMSEVKDESTINDLFQELSISTISAPGVKESEKKNDSFRKESVGIWERVSVNGKFTFQRTRDKQEEWHNWANVHELPIKSSKKRIVLIGESVARGYFYAPKYSVAKELDAVLKASNDIDDVEVIDLSKTSIEIDELSDVIASSPLLEPDQIVLFAGNNWIYELYDAVAKEDINKLWSIYQEKQFNGVKPYLEELFENAVFRFMDKVSEISSKYNIPFLIVIPGFNLKDWLSDESLQSLSLLPKNQVEDWLKAKENAERAFIEQEYEILEQEAQKMIQLDVSNPVGYEFLAKSKVKKGEILEAINCLDEAKDTVIYGRALLSTPRCYRIVREAIKKKCLQQNIPVVDLFSVFNELDENKVPGRELYLDYCHLSVLGIKISMKYVAKEIIEHLTHRLINIAEIPESAIEPKNFTKAIAHFSAAIHNAHWSQPQDILEYHCKKAVELDPKIKKVMLQYVDFASRKTSNVFCGKFEDILLNGHMTQYEGGIALTHGQNLKLMDLELVDAIISAVGESGKVLEDSINKLRLSEHCIEKRTIDLLESFYHLNGYNSYDNRSGRNYFQIRSNQKEFRFFSEGQENCIVKMCFRSSVVSKSKEFLKVYLNSRSQKVKEVQCSQEWTNVTFEISGNILSKGLNTLIIEWPIDQSHHWLINQIENKLLVDTLFPVVGEIYSLTISSISDKLC